MARTFNNLWNGVIDFENLYRAYRAAKKGKRYRYESLEFKRELEENLIILQNELIWKTYKPLPLRQFYVYEPKQRLISAPAFRDRVVHHSLCSVIEPIFESKFINETFACRVGRGTHVAMRHISKCARIANRLWGNYYVLKCDIHKYFPSIDHNVLKRILRRAIRDRHVLNLINTIIDSFEMEGKGIPIGALTSQLFANAYLDPLDHFIKEKCRIKYYARYMDDFVIIHHDKSYLRDLMGEINNFVKDRLNLALNPKSGIFPGKHGIDFCGYRIWPSHIKARKSTLKRAKRRLRKMAVMYRANPGILQHAHDSIQSFLGYIKHCSGWRSAKSILESIVFQHGEKSPGENRQIAHFRRKRVLKNIH
jgi:retron-type reverse transcriptase